MTERTRRCISCGQYDVQPPRLRIHGANPRIGDTREIIARIHPFDPGDRRYRTIAIDFPDRRTYYNDKSSHTRRQSDEPTQDPRSTHDRRSDPE